MSDSDGWLRIEACLGRFGGLRRPHRALAPPPIAIGTFWSIFGRNGLRRAFLRTTFDYETVPATCARCAIVFSCQPRTEEAAYALVGEAESTGIVYELVGHPAVFRRLWDVHHRPLFRSVRE